MNETLNEISNRLQKQVSDRAQAIADSNRRSRHAPRLKPKAPPVVQLAGTTILEDRGEVILITQGRGRTTPTETESPPPC